MGADFGIEQIRFKSLLYGVGVVVMFADSQSRRLGDLAAGTIVVREGRGVKNLDALLPEKNRAELWRDPRGMMDGLPVDKLTRAEVDLIDTFLNRRNQFSNPDVVGKQIVQRIYEKMELPSPSLDRQDEAELLVQIRSALAHKNAEE